MVLDLLTLDDFSDKVGQAFLIEEAGLPPIELTLTEASAVRNYSNAQRAPFSLIFAAGGEVLPQRMYSLRHDALGLQSIFLVPIAKNGDVVSYQALFN